MAYGNSGIYCITNTINGKKYIGQTNNLSKRKVQHLSDLRNGVHDNRLMQADWNADENADANADENADENADANADENAEANADENADASADENTDENADANAEEEPAAETDAE